MFYLKSLNYRAAVIDSLTKENERLRKRAEEIDVVYNSASYKLGHALLKPISFIKRKVSKKED